MIGTLVTLMSFLGVNLSTWHCRLQYNFCSPLTHRSEVLLLASRKVVSETETNVQLYPASDVQKMFTILNLPVPDFILRAAQGEVCGHTTVACLSHVAYALH